LLLSAKITVIYYILLAPQHLSPSVSFFQPFYAFLDTCWSFHSNFLSCWLPLADNYSPKCYSNKENENSLYFHSFHPTSAAVLTFPRTLHVYQAIRSGFSRVEPSSWLVYLFRICYDANQQLAFLLPEAKYNDVLKLCSFISFELLVPVEACLLFHAPWLSWYLKGAVSHILGPTVAESSEATYLSLLSFF
jgi:hypothetical protein